MSKFELRERYFFPFKYRATLYLYYLFISRPDFEAEDAFYDNLLNEKHSHVFYEQFPSQLFK